ncbi:MAG: hypothetical protein IKH80_06125 [Bacteroidaceae bacterium]|nr:hypothetical protein [Bacteroidaceae bacterium]
MNNIKNTFRAGFVLAAGLVAMYSCSDTWDDHYNAGLSALKFNGTTMQALEETAPDFAKVVKAYGFSRELSSDNTFTVWAPADGSFELSDYVGANGERVADSAEVVNDFIKNHVALYSLSLTPKDQSFSLLNEKRGSMTSDGMFGHIKIDEQKNNISCLNGIVHLIESPSPYAYNLFEMIAKQYKEDPEDGKDTLSLYAYLYDEKVNKDTLIENKSVSRGVDADGNKIWVSQYLEKNNTVLKNYDARLYEEDSLFIAILPSAKAWGERYKKAASLLQFNPSEDNRAAGTCDSLTRHYANSFAMTDLFYNKNANEHWEDSLKSTNYYNSWHGVVDWTQHVYYSKEPKYMPEDKEINDILAKCGEPVECSNGTAYLVDEYPFSAVEQFFKKIKVTASDGAVNKLGSGDNWTYTKGVQKSFGARSGIFVSSIPTYDEEGEQTGVDQKRQNYRFVDFVPTSGNITVGFNVPNTLSGLYDIYIVTCPMWLASDFNNIDMAEWDVRPYRFTATIIERENEGKNIGQFPTKGKTLENPDPIDEKQKTVFLSQGMIYDDAGHIIVNDTTYLGQYQFKNAYYGRADYGVIIQIASSILSSQRKDFSNEMLISSIILKPHDEDTVAEEAKTRKSIQLTTSNIRK